MLQSFRDRKLIRAVAERISKLFGQLGRPLRIMHVCGSHEHTLVRWALRKLLPEELEMVAGPGCPVCVASTQEIREAIYLARQKGVILATFGDMLRDVTPYGTLLDARAQGADVRVVYSGLDAVKIARENPTKEVVFFAVGFETTAAPTAAIILSDPPKNFSILTAHRLTPPAVKALVDMGVAFEGMIAPGHVSSIVGAKAWDGFGMPTVVAGFEPLDVMLGIERVLKMLLEGKVGVENEYTRVVKWEGNLKAQRMMAQAFEVRDTWWRGLGVIPKSGFYIKPDFARLDARERFGVRFEDYSEDTPPGCICHLIITGRAYPDQCPHFLSNCVPENPYGPCMVSVEGTCYVWARAGKV